jgi:PqqD family protein of HPr-rel-A system
VTWRWQSTAQDNLLWLDWGDSSAVFHRPSGKTHFVNSATVLLLRQVLIRPMDEESASRALLAAHGLAEQPQYLEQVSGLLLRLEQLGLVERVAA